MKILTVIMLFTLWSKSCEKVQKNTLVKGKVIYRSCATIAVQVLDEKHKSLGQPTWQMAEEKTVFNNVFAVSNQCSFPAEFKVGAEFSFVTVLQDSTMKDCIQCFLWDNPPTTKQMIKVLK